MTLGSWHYVGGDPMPRVWVESGPGAGGGHWEWRRHDDGASVGRLVVADTDPVVADSDPESDPDMAVCESCDQVVPIASTTMTCHDEVVCGDCSDVCDWCGDTFRESDLERVGCADVCNTCSQHVIECYHCDAIFDPDCSGIDVGSWGVARWACNSCSDRYVWCGSCDTYRDTRSVSSCESCDSCSDCCECASDPVARNEAGELLPYDYKPESFSFYVSHESGPYVSDSYCDPSVLFFGVEVETENEGDRYRSDLVKYAADKLAPVVYVKHDGSLHDGLELVTHPVTFDYFAKWAAFDETLLGLADRGARSWGNGRCGIHVHMTRSAFVSRSHLFAFALWWYRNREIVQRIAGRSDYSLDRWASLSAHQGPREYGHPRLIDKVTGGVSQSRYAGVNLCNDDTVEVRVFRGTLRPARVRGYVELCAAVFDHTMAITSHDIRAGFLDWSSFVRFVDHTKFPNIADLLAARGVN